MDYGFYDFVSYARCTVNEGRWFWVVFRFGFRFLPCKRSGLWLRANGRNRGGPGKPCGRIGGAEGAAEGSSAVPGSVAARHAERACTPAPFLVRCAWPDETALRNRRGQGVPSLPRHGSASGSRRDSILSG